MGNFDPATAAIAIMTPSDAEGLWPLSQAVGWNQLADDWRLMLRAGCAYGVRDSHGALVASALVLPLGRSISWISMVIVLPVARGRGLGRRLLARCLADIDAAGIAAGLDATPLGRPIYLPLGFRDLYPLARWSLAGVPRAAVEPPAGVRVRPLASGELAPIVDYDRRRSGLDRASILAHLLERAPAAARVATGADGRVLGFALARDGDRATQIGPVIAEDERIALALLSTALREVNTPVIVDVPNAHATIGGWLQAQGASAPRTFMRMLRGEYRSVEAATFVFALGGAELA